MSQIVAKLSSKLKSSFVLASETSYPKDKILI